MGSAISRVQPFATPWTVARQAPLSMGFPRQEYWSGWVAMPSSRRSSRVVVRYSVSTTRVTPLLSDAVTAASSGPAQPSHLACGLPPRKGGPCPTAVGAGCLAVVAPASIPTRANTHTHTHTHARTRCCLKPGSSIALRAGGHINQRP